MRALDAVQSRSTSSPSSPANPGPTSVDSRPSAFSAAPSAPRQGQSQRSGGSSGTVAEWCDAGDAPAMSGGGPSDAARGRRGRKGTKGSKSSSSCTGGGSNSSAQASGSTSPRPPLYAVSPGHVGQSYANENARLIVSEPLPYAKSPADDSLAMTLPRRWESTQSPPTPPLAGLSGGAHTPPRVRPALSPPRSTRGATGTELEPLSPSTASATRRHAHPSGGSSPAARSPRQRSPSDLSARARAPQLLETSIGGSPINRSDAAFMSALATAGIGAGGLHGDGPLMRPHHPYSSPPASTYHRPHGRGGGGPVALGRPARDARDSDGSSLGTSESAPGFLTPPPPRPLDAASSPSLALATAGGARAPHHALFPVPPPLSAPPKSAVEIPAHSAFSPLSTSSTASAGIDARDRRGHAVRSNAGLLSALSPRKHQQPASANDARVFGATRTQRGTASSAAGGGPTSSDLFSSTRMLSSIRALTKRRLSEDAAGTATLLRRDVDADSTPAFAMGGESSGTANNNNNNSSSKLSVLANAGLATTGGAGLAARPPAVEGSSSPAALGAAGGAGASLSPRRELKKKGKKKRNEFSLTNATRAGSGSARGASSTGSPSPAPPYEFRVVLSSGSSSTRQIKLLCGAGCVQGMRSTMEDEHFQQLCCAEARGQPVSLVGILDGHCGRRVATLGKQWLPHYFFQHTALGDNNALAMVESVLQSDQAIFHALRRPSPPPIKAEKRAATKKKGKKTVRARGRETLGGVGGCDDLNELDDDFADAPSANGVEDGGSTLIAAAVHGRMLYVACLGDARAVLYDGHTTIAMSEDHKPQAPKESSRISRCGGFVQFGRVCGVLAVSRALGDYAFKFSDNELQGTRGFLGNWNPTQRGTHSPRSQMGSASARFSSGKELMVSNIADVKQISLTDASQFLLLACDGLWDVLSNEEATQFVKDFLTYTPDINDPAVVAGERAPPATNVVQRALDSCCQKLAEFAVDRGSTDNVSVMVLFFHDVVECVVGFSTAPPAAAAGTSSAARGRKADATRPPF